VKTRRGGRRAEERMGIRISVLLTADERRFYGSSGLVDYITLKLYFRWSPPPANTHPSIHLPLAPKARRNNRKAPASSLTTRAGGAYREGAAAEPKKGWGLE